MTKTILVVVILFAFFAVMVIAVRILAVRLRRRMWAKVGQAIGWDLVQMQDGFYGLRGTYDGAEYEVWDRERHKASGTTGDRSVNTTLDTIIRKNGKIVYTHGSAMPPGQLTYFIETYCCAADSDELHQIE